MSSSLAVWVALMLALWIAVIGLIALAYRKQLSAIWREPVLRHPILIVESDDWGAGPLTQARALREIAQVLARHRDKAGRHPVMSLALVLAVPDGAIVREGSAYRRVCLDDPRFAEILEALRQGSAQGVFALQLHGLEHYWPETLMRCTDPKVAGWLRQEAPARTEDLPAHLQSRWVDASHLPSQPHDDSAIRDAVAEEVEVYRRIVGEAPRVVVPPTFVWTRQVERAWSDRGIECVVTPGWRYTWRDAQGAAAGDEGPIVNGDRAGGVGYVARCDYFEPARGRDAMHALRILDRAVFEGRPCVLENHRDNFIGEAQACRHGLDELDQLYRQGLARWPDLRFLSTGELHSALRDRNARWLVATWRERWPALVQRLRNSGRLWRLLRLSGAAVAGGLVARLLALAEYAGASRTDR